MHRGNRQPETTTRRHARRRYQPALQTLEARIALAIDLANIAGDPADPNAPGPYGVLEAGLNQVGGAGWSVAEVGDVNGDGFDDFLIGAPTITAGAVSPSLSVGPGAVYLVLGSNQVGATTVNWLTLNAQQRVGDLGVLGNTAQTNPINGQPGFNFNGLTFIAGANPVGQLGASVAAAGDVNGDGLADLLIGAPGGTDPNGAANSTGRAYLIYGSSALGTRTNKIVDLDNPSGNADLNILTFVASAQANARIGSAVAGVGDFIADGTPDIAIGAPNATITGLASQGAVYVVSGSVIRQARTETIDLSTVGQQGGRAGVIFAGDVAGDAAGFAVNPAGNTSGRPATGGVAPSDLLIGAPDVGVTGIINGNGSAYLIYGATLAELQALATTVNNFTVIDLGGVGVDVPGAVFNGAVLGDRTGWAVNTAGDFNADGLADFMVGSPGFDISSVTDVGRVTLIFGRGQTPDPPGPISGSFNLSALPEGLPFVEFDGVGTNALAGFSLSPTGLINNDTINEIIIGSPGVNGGQGQVYLIPGNPDLLGVQLLSNTESSPIQGLIITLSQPNAANFLGTSVSGRLGVNRAGRTADSDALGDVIIGAPGFTLPGTSRTLAGGGFMLEGALVPLPDIVSTAIPMGIAGVDGDFTPPFDVSATGPANLQIFVLSNATIQPPFIPAQDLDPTTIVVNGVAFPNATIVPDTVDRNQDGLPDAIITINPRSSLGLQTSTTTLTVEGRTLATSPLPNRRVLGSAPIRVTGGGGGGGGGLGGPRETLREILNPNAAVPRFGERLLPSPAAIGRLAWRPGLAPAIANRQFFPTLGFRGRLNEFYHGSRFFHDPLGSKLNDTGYGVTTLGQDVFTRSRFRREGVFDARAFFPRQPAQRPGPLGHVGQFGRRVWHV